jgi:hypothetical protein
MNDCRRAYAMAEDPAQPYDGDVLWAVCTLYWGGKLGLGAERAAMLRETFPAIAEAYPPPAVVPAITTSEVSAADVKKLHDLTGEGLYACKRAFDLLEDPTQPFDGDVLWALCTVYVGGLAINVKPAEKRAQWNIEHGASRAAMLRERDPALAEAYPPKSAAPAP